MELNVSTVTLGAFRISGDEDNGLHVTSFSWRTIPRIKRRSRPRGHGSVDLTRYYEGRLFDLRGRLHGVDEATAMASLDEFEKWIALDGDTVALQWIIAGRDDAEFSQVRIDGDLEYEFDHASQGSLTWALTLFSEDPRRYGSTERTGAYDPTEGSTDTGVALPLTFPLDFSGDATTHLSVENGGNYPTPPVFTISGPITNPIIDNDTTGESITTTGLELLTGETAVVDVAAKTLEVEGTLRPDLIDASLTTWFELPAGVSRLRLRGSDMVADETELSVSFFDARI